MEVVEEDRYSHDYMDTNKRSIANAVQVFFSDGSSTEKVAVEYPIGHRRRRAEGVPLLEEKFSANLRTRLPEKRARKLEDLLLDRERLVETPVNELMSLLSI